MARHLPKSPSPSTQKNTKTRHDVGIMEVHKIHTYPMTKISFAQKQTWYLIAQKTSKIYQFFQNLTSSFLSLQLHLEQIELLYEQLHQHIPKEKQNPSKGIFNLPFSKLTTASRKITIFNRRYIFQVTGRQIRPCFLWSPVVSRGAPFVLRQLKPSPAKTVMRSWLGQMGFPDQQIRFFHLNLRQGRTR